MLNRTVRKALALLLALLLLSIPICGSADFGSGGNMISPATLVLIPASGVHSRFWVYCDNFSWSYAPLFFKPDERVETESGGAAPTDPEVLASADRLKLTGSSAFTLSWEDGWRPDTVSVRIWSADVFDHPDQADDFSLGEKDLPYGRIVLEPDCLYQFTAVWERNHGEERGQAEYYVITEQMSDQETAEARARVSAPFSKEDLQLLTLKIGDAECILGITTPQDLIDQGLDYYVDFDGSYTVRTDPDQEGEVYVYSDGNNAPDQPITSVNAFWAYEMPLEYCGFDGIISDANTDPDNLFLPEYDRLTEEELRELVEEGNEDDNTGWWGGMIYWMYSRFNVEESVEGIYSTVVTLSNGRELSISSHDSPVSLALLEENAFRPLSVYEDDADQENGSFGLLITDTSLLDTDQYFTAELYQPDLYPADGLSILQPGDRIVIDGRNVKIASVILREENESDDRTEGTPPVGYEIGCDGIGAAEFFTFRPASGKEGLYTVSGLEGRVSASLLESVRIQLPLPENFICTEISAGDEVSHPAEEFLELLRSGDLRQWNQYNTTIRFGGGVPVQILHSGDFSDPDGNSKP